MTPYLDVMLQRRQNPSAVCPSGVLDGMEIRIGRRHQTPCGELAEEDRMWPGRVRHEARNQLCQWGLDTIADSATLLLSELVTNAFKHGKGSEIGVRLCRTCMRVRIEVEGGSPDRPTRHPADLLDESGRGLFLVDALAGAWGISDDGTMTWCSLPLHQEPAEVMQTTAVSSPIVREWSASLPTTGDAVRRACTGTRTHLTVLRWHGNINGATEVVRRLVANAVEHGADEGDCREIGLRLAITEAGELLAEVSDPSPGFPDFKAATEGARGRGLWEVRQLGGQLSWFMLPNGGKTVQARVEAGEIPA